MNYAKTTNHANEQWTAALAYVVKFDGVHTERL